MFRTIFDDLYDLNRRMNSVFEGYNYRENNWGRTNLYESADDYVIVSRLPGVNKDDLEITLKDNTLHISGDRKKRSNEDSSLHLNERYSGKFERNFILNEKVDPDKVSAEIKNGLLVVKLSKSAETKPRKIAIN